jgi:hypothetical protein
MKFMPRIILIFLPLSFSDSDIDQVGGRDDGKNGKVLSLFVNTDNKAEFVHA